MGTCPVVCFDKNKEENDMRNRRSGGSDADSLRRKALRIEKKQFEKTQAGTAHAKIHHKHRMS